MIDWNSVHEERLPEVLAANLDRNFEALVLTYQDRLYAFALRLTCSPQDAEEVAQDAFLRAYHALAGYDHARIATLKLRPWLYQIVLNLVRNRMRGRHLSLVSLDASGDGAPAEPADDAGKRPDAAWEQAERSDELAALVDALPERYRAAVILRHIEGLGYGEVAVVLKQPVGTVKANVHRGIHLLREAVVQKMEEESFTHGRV